MNRSLIVFILSGSMYAGCTGMRQDEPPQAFGSAQPLVNNGHSHSPEVFDPSITLEKFTELTHLGKWDKHVALVGKYKELFAMLKEVENERNGFKHAIVEQLDLTKGLKKTIEDQKIALKKKNEEISALEAAREQRQWKAVGVTFFGTVGALALLGQFLKK